MAKITIKAIEDGPCIINVDGNKVAALCRCGASNKKPHCDGSHSNSGFKAKATEIEV